MKPHPIRSAGRSLLALLAAACVIIGLPATQFLVAADEPSSQSESAPDSMDSLKESTTDNTSKQSQVPEDVSSTSPAEISSQSEKQQPEEEQSQQEMPVFSEESAELEEESSAADSVTAPAISLSLEGSGYSMQLIPVDADALAAIASEYPGLQAAGSVSPDSFVSSKPGTGNAQNTVVLLQESARLELQNDSAAALEVPASFTAVVQLDSAQLSAAYQREFNELPKDDPIITATLHSELEEQTIAAPLSQISSQTLSVPLAANENYEVSAVVGNPSFTVQYYVYSTVPKSSTKQKSSADNIPIIDSSAKGYLNAGDANGAGGSLPSNGNLNPPVIYLDLATKGSGANATGTIDTVDTFSPYFEQQTYTYHDAPNPHYFNKLIENGNYKLKEIWILKDGKDADSTDRADFDIYSADAKFTNNADYAKEHPGVLLITDGTTIRMVYDETEQGTITVPANFFDYDISKGKNSAGNYVTSTGGSNARGAWGTEYGINANTNYTDPNASEGKLAFGNMNTGTHLGKVTWTDGSGVVNYLNKYNNASYKGCTFGLADSLDANNNIQFASGVEAPDLFSLKAVNGKTIYKNSGLQFSRTGDTYILQSVQVRDANNQLSTVLTGLDTFTHPGNYTSIWTNDFWPLDGHPGVDGLSGGSKTVKWDGWLWSSPNSDNVRGSHSTGSFPASDDGQAHNPLFGMQHSVKFTLTEDYTGPLDYFFFGDDDMWVFLDGKPIVDIGGVHSSVGQYVNLWDYIPHGDAGTHELQFFYTERGLSGSTCYMQFTLPSVSVAQPEHDTGNLIIEKQSSGMEDAGKEYGFVIRLRDESGNVLPDEYAYTKYDASGTKVSSSIILRDQQEFTLQAGQYIECQYLPDGAVFTVEETDPGSATEVLTSAGQTYYPQSAQANATPVITGKILKNNTVKFFFQNQEPKNQLGISKSVSLSDPSVQIPVSLNAQDYVFRLAKTDGSLLYSAGSQYTLMEEDGSTSTKTLPDSGLIFLHDGEQALFVNSYLAQGTDYVVEELVPQAQKPALSAVTFDGTAAKWSGQTVIDGTTYQIAQSPVRSTAGSPDVPQDVVCAVDNTLDVSQFGSLTLEKVLPEGVSLDGSFVFDLTLNGSPVADGLSYTVDGEEKTFVNSQITLSVGQKAVIDHIPAGTTYQITEEAADGYTSTIDQPQGTVDLQENVQVQALNTPQPVSVSIAKLNEEGNTLHEEVTFALYSSMPKEGAKTTTVNKTQYWLADHATFTGTGTIENLTPGASYVLEETKAPDGYALLGESIVFHVDLDGVITLDGEENKAVSLSDDHLGLRVVNYALPGLPDAGASGTGMLITGGGLLAAAALALGAWRRFKGNQVK